MSHNVREHLRLGTDDYDAAIRRFIPGYETMLAVAAGAVAAVRPELVVDLGAGTGALSEELLERPEVGSVQLLDADPEMLSQARRRLARFGDRARCTLGSFYEPLSAGDAFAASLSLHHIPSLEAKGGLFARIYQALSPGGVFVNADANMPGEPSERDRLYRYWADHLVASGIAEERAWKYFEEWAEEDTYQPRAAEIERLGAAGFAAQCVWQNGPMSVVVARKP